MRPTTCISVLGKCLHQPIFPRVVSSIHRRNASYVNPRNFSRDPELLSKPPGRAGTQDQRLAQYVLDEQISTPFVQIKAAESNKLGEPQSLQQLLRSLDRTTHAVNQLASPEGREFAIVEVIEKDELKRKVRARENMVAEAQKAIKAKKPKQIELNWAIAENDLQLKLKQLQQFLEKGKRVEILLAARKHARKATPDEGHKLMNTLREKLESLDAKEVKPMEGKVLGQALMVVSK